MRAALASHNPHKLDELRAALPGWEVTLLDADEFPPEEGETYYENARAKARFGRSIGDAGVWMLGEDSGIEVEALDGGPGIESARWSGRWIEELLERLEGVVDRRARYVCELVCLSPELDEFRGTGVLEGRVAAEPRGTEGFGYDPIFVPDGEERTVAELGDEWKRRHSHRARAAEALREAVADLA
ncbi:MAG: non-canonical purine NTP pyrophosphatase [Gaiellaceae bacterium]